MAQKPVVLVALDKAVICKILKPKLHLGQLTPEDINNPSSEIAQQIFSNFVRYTLNVSESCMSTLPLSATSDHDPELHRRSIPIIIVFQCLKAFIKDHSGDKLDLTMCDFVNPQRINGRFKKITSFLADYIRFHENAQPIFNEVSEEFSYQRQEEQQLNEELQEEEKRKEMLISQQNARKRKDNELCNEHIKLKEELMNFMVACDEKKAFVEALFTEKEATEEKTESIENEILSGKKMVDHLKEEILSSPEELKREMAARKKQIEELKECLAGSKLALAERMEAIEICSSAEKNVPAIQEKINQFAMMKEEILELLDAVNEDNRKLSDLEDELKFTEEKKIKTRELMVDSAQLHEQVRKEHLQRNEQLNEKIKEITKQISQMGTNQPDVSRDIEKKSQELRAAKNATSKAVAKVVEETRETMAKYEKVLAMFQKVQRDAVEKQVAADRATSRLVNACVGPLISDYTFSTSSCCAEDDENTAPGVGTNFNVFPK